LRRRNELSGNLALEQELYFIRKVNQWADRLGGRFRHIEVREVALDRTSTWRASSIAAPGSEPSSSTRSCGIRLCSGYLSLMLR
jgi:hypothetical protein